VAKCMVKCYVFCQNISTLLDRPYIFYNTTAESFIIKKLCKNWKVAFFSHCLEDLGVIYKPRLYLVGKSRTGDN